MLTRLSPGFDKLNSVNGRPSIAPERLLRALMLQVIYTISSERQLMEKINCNLLFRWFVGMNVDEAVWHHTVFSHNGDRLLRGGTAARRSGQPDGRLPRREAIERNAPIYKIRRQCCSGSRLGRKRD